MKALDLFSGSGSFSTVSSTYGYDVTSIDIRKRKNTCEPSLRMDILDLDMNFFKINEFDVIWAGIPCDIWSYASAGFHLDSNFTPLTEKAVVHLEIFHKTIKLIEHLSPVYFFFFIPRGKMRHYQGMLDFLNRNDAVIKECTLSSYGFPTTKPTTIFTNFKQLKLRELDGFGRGHKNKELHSFDNLTKAQRQTTPALLINDILAQLHNR